MRRRRGTVSNVYLLRYTTFPFSFFSASRRLAVYRCRSVDTAENFVPSVDPFCSSAILSPSNDLSEKQGVAFLRNSIRREVLAPDCCVYRSSCSCSHRSSRSRIVVIMSRTTSTAVEFTSTNQSVDYSVEGG